MKLLGSSQMTFLRAPLSLLPVRMIASAKWPGALSSGLQVWALGRYSKSDTGAALRSLASLDSLKEPARKGPETSRTGFR